MKSVVAVLLLLFGAMVFACEPSEIEFGRIRNSSKHKIDGPLRIDEVERVNLVNVRETGKTVPFGYINDEWQILRRRYREGDELFRVEYRDGSRYWDEHYVLVRNGCVIALVRTGIS